jgi:hypothetical protein
MNLRDHQLALLIALRQDFSPRTEPAPPPLRPRFFLCVLCVKLQEEPAGSRTQNRDAFVTEPKPARAPAKTPPAEVEAS